jgi:hypothetical protein
VRYNSAEISRKVLSKVSSQYSEKVCFVMSSLIVRQKSPNFFHHNIAFPFDEFAKTLAQSDFF